MNRRYLFVTAAVVVGAMVAVLALYLSDSRAADAASGKMNKGATSSQTELAKRLVDRIEQLEARVEALEHKSGTFLIGPSANPRVQPQVSSPQTWPHDGFGPVKVIPAE
jgi:hypothetical protein